MPCTPTPHKHNQTKDPLVPPTLDRFATHWQYDNKEDEDLPKPVHVVSAFGHQSFDHDFVWPG